MTKPLKVIAIVAGALLAMAVLLALLIPVIFRDRVVEVVRTELNRRLDATVEFADVDVSFLSTFPLLSVKVDNLSITGQGAFEGQTLFGAKSVEAGANVFALLDDEMQVEELILEEPEAHLLFMKDGKTNYDIVKGGTEAVPAESAPPTEVHFRLENYEVHHGTLTAHSPDAEMSVEGLNIVGKVGLSESIQKWLVHATADKVTASASGFHYFRDAGVELNLDATVESQAQRLQIDEGKIQINELPISILGSAAWPGEGIDLDLRLSSENNASIKDLVSALPHAYAANFKQLDASGAFSLGATIEGQFGPNDEDIPSFEAHARVTNGRFKYPDLPTPIRNLQLDATVTHPGGPLDKMQIRVRKYGFAAGKSEASGRLFAATPLSVPRVEFTLDGRLDLEELATAYPMPDAQDLRGQLMADVDVETRGAKISKLTGRVEASNVQLRAEGTPPIQVQSMKLALSPTATTVEELRASTGSSNASITGSLSPITSLLLADETVKGVLSLKSSQIHVDDFSTESPSSAKSDPFKIPDKTDLVVNMDVQRLTYDDLILRDIKGQLRVKDQTVRFKNVQSTALGGTLGIDGTVSTPVGAEPFFDMNYSLKKAKVGEAFAALGTLQAFAPILAAVTGRFTSEVAVSGKLDEGLIPRLRTLGATGFVQAFGGTLKDFKPLQVLSTAVPMIPDSLSFNRVKTRFTVEEGAVRVNEFPVKTKHLTLLVGGRHGLDQEMEYLVTTEVPAKKLREAAVSKNLQGLGLDLNKATTVRLRAELTGSLKAPRVKLNADASDMPEALREAVVAKVEEQTEKLKEEASQRAQQLIDEARKRAAQIRAQARASADRASKEGYARADRLEKEGAGNPLKQIAARQGAKALRNETDRAVQKLLAEADKRADDLIRKAEQQAQQLTR